MTPFQQVPLASFFRRIAARSPGLLPACRWLLLGPDLARWICPTDGTEPTQPELIELIRLLDDEAPAIEAIGRSLVTTSRHAAEAELEVGLEKLSSADQAEWIHPAVVLGRPCPKFEDLLARCVSHLASDAGESRRRLESVRGKLEKAVALEETARRRAGQG